jgi:hypothetical protein
VKTHWRAQQETKAKDVAALFIYGYTTSRGGNRALLRAARRVDFSNNGAMYVLT